MAGGDIMPRLLGACVIVGFAALSWFAVIEPAQNWSAQNSEALGKAQSEAQRLIGSIDGLRTEKSLLSSNAEFEDIWTADSLGQATALIQAKLGETARGQGVSLRSIAPLPRPDLPLLDAVAFRIEAEASLDQLLNLLTELEFSRPLLIIEAGSLRRLARAQETSTQPIVFAQLDILAPVSLPEDGS